MVLEIVQYGNPVLRAKGTEITTADASIQKLAADMLETMHSANGVGLAAQQIGIAVQLTVIDVCDVEDRPSEMFVNGGQVKLADYMPLILLNPVLELGGEKEMGLEGCLSFPSVTAEIPRATHVKTRAKTLDGQEIEFEASGLLARALQHEVDHLNGILFIDRMNAAAKATLAGKLKRLQKNAD